MHYHSARHSAYQGAVFLFPRHLNRELAAAYVGVSVDVFDDEVRAGMWPAGERRGRKGGRHTWDRALLVSCPTDNFANSCDLSEDFIGCCGPKERARATVVVGDEGVDASDQLLGACE